MKRSFFLPTFALLAFAGLASAASVIWTGATDMNWTQPDATSWNATYNSGDTANFTATGAGTVTIGAGGVTLGQVNITAGTYTFSGGSLGGSGGIAISGGGLTLTGSNSYDGVTAVSGGVSLVPQNSNALGSTVGATTVADGSRIDLNVGGLTIGENITIAGLGLGGGNGVIRNRGVTNIWSGNITASSAPGGSGLATIASDNGGLLTISGAVDVGTRGLQAGGAGNITISGNISGSGLLNKAHTAGAATNTGTLTLTGTNNSYSGATTIDGGTLQVGNGTDAGSLGNTSAITNNGSLVFNVGSGNRTVGVAISGSGSLTQNSSGGTLTLSRSNSYTGTTTVSAGTLLVSSTGTLASGSAVTVASNAAIGGDGTIGGTLTLSNGAKSVFDLNNTPLTVSGTFALNNSFGVASLVTSSLVAIDWSTVNTGTYQFLGTTFAFDATTISNYGIGNALTTGGKQVYFTSGSNLLDVVVAVPEPATWALLAFSLTTVMVLRRRRRRNS
jgi:autotransporter-associated beta strand protein